MGPLSSRDGENVEQIWTSECWPRRLFPKEFQDSRLLIFQRGFQDKEDLRAGIQRVGGVLVDVLDKFRQKLSVRMVYLSASCAFI